MTLFITQGQIVESSERTRDCVFVEVIVKTARSCAYGVDVET